MTVVCSICHRKKGFFGPALYQCASCGTVYCEACIKTRLPRKGGLFSKKPVCIRCGSSNWIKV